MRHLAGEALRFPDVPASRWHRAGLGPRSERVLDLGSAAVVLLLAMGWTWSIVMTSMGRLAGAGSTAASMTAALTDADAPSAAYLTDVTLDALTSDLRGASGKLLAEIRPPGAAVADSGSSGAGARLRVATPGAGGPDVAPRTGVWRLAAAVGSALKPIADLNLISLRPGSDRQNGRIGSYLLGSWPGENGRAVRLPSKAPPARYRPPSGFIEVTPANADTRVSEHFTLRDFLTHDQSGVWPKYLVLEMRNVDKLELVLTDLQQRGADVSGVTVMSGFRTPQYNEGGGNTDGRAGLSRHMYGDAADIFIDSNHDGVMDDLDHDGRITIADARAIQRSVDRVEAAHPGLVGGVGVYPAEAGHGPFIHIDSRGYRARWVGSGGG